MKEALKQIIDLLQPVAALTDRTPFEHSEVIQRCVDATEIALEALAQPVQEHIGEAHLMQEGFTHCIWAEAAVPVWTKLYTTPPQRTWIGLTEVEKGELWGRDTVIPFSYADAIEAKLKEKNT